MKFTCYVCGRTASGMRDDLLDAGWARLVVRASFGRSAAPRSAVHTTFTACPDHAYLVPRSAEDLLDDAKIRAGSLRMLVGV